MSTVHYSIDTLTAIRERVAARALLPVDGSGLALADYWTDLVSRLPADVRVELANALPNVLVPTQSAVERWATGDLEPAVAAERALTGLSRLWALSYALRAAGAGAGRDPATPEEPR
jgi:hypothetical protein